MVSTENKKRGSGSVEKRRRNNGLCSDHDNVARICDLLQTEDGIYINQFLHLLIEDYDLNDLEEHLHCTEKNCGISVFYRFFSYLKVFKDVKEVQEKINSVDFAIPVLEKFILFLMDYSERLNEDRHFFIDKYLYFLEPQKFIALLTESKELSRDANFLIHVLTRLDNKDMDALLAKSVHIQSTLVELFTTAQESEVKEILFKNPVLYDYILMFLDLEGKSDEATGFGKKYEETIEHAKKIQKIIEHAKGLTQENTDQGRGERIGFLVHEIQNTKDSKHALEILKHHNVFVNEKEKQIVEMLVSDTKMQDFLALHLDE